MLWTHKDNPTPPSHAAPLGDAIHDIPRHTFLLGYTLGADFMGLATGNIKCIFQFLWDWQAYPLTKETDA